MKIKQVQLIKGLTVPSGKMGQKSIQLPRTLFKGPQSVRDIEMQRLPDGTLEVRTEGEIILLGINMWEVCLAEDAAEVVSAPKTTKAAK